MTYRERTTDEARSSLFTTEDRGDVRILRFLPHVEPAGADPYLMRPLWAFLERQMKDPSKVLIVDSPAGILGPESMDAFWARGLPRGDQGTSLRDPGTTTGFEAQMDLVREENALRTFVERIQALDSLVVCVMTGVVDLPFLGLGLACDYRVISEDTVFLNRTLEAGLPPCGATPWFLVHSLGRAKGADVLLTKREILAHFAHALGLVNKVVPLDELQREALAFAEALAQGSAARLRAMKQALRATQKSLTGYLDEEAEIFTRCLHWSAEEARRSVRPDG